MRKRPYILLIAATVVFVSFVFGFLAGRMTVKEQSLKISTADISVYSSQETTTNSFKIDINTADIDQLVLLDGIGENIAQRIIEYREEFGPFATIEDLLKVNGIGQKKFEEIADYITAGG